MSRKVMAAILAHREVAPLLSDEPFSVDGTLVKGEPLCAIGSRTMASASMKSFQPKAEGAPKDDEGPGDPPTQDIAPENQPAETQTETDPMPRPTHQHRNAEVDFRGEKRSNGRHCRAIGPSDNGDPCLDH